MAKLDSLIVDLQLNSAELRKGLDEANNKLDSFGKRINSLAGVITFAAIGKAVLTAGRALGNLVLHGAETADAMGKAAQAAGVAVESFSALNYAASLGGVSTEQLSTSMLALNKHISDAGSGNRDAVALFSALGVGVRDAAGNVRNADVVMSDIAEKFSGMADGADKAKLATEFFGKAGAQLLPLLNGGAGGLAAMTAEAHRFGAIITDKAAKSAEEFNDNLVRMKVAADSLGLSIADQLGPAMTGLTAQMMEGGGNMSVISGLATLLATALKAIATAAVIIIAPFKALIATLMNGLSIVVDLVRGDFAAAMSGMGDSSRVVSDSLKDSGKTLELIWGDGAVAVEASGKKQVAVASEVIAAIEAEKKKAAAAEKARDEAVAAAKVAAAKAAAAAIAAIATDLAQAGERSRGSAAMTAKNIDRTADFRGIGQTDAQQTSADTAGFASFDEALASLARQTRIHARQLDEATNLVTAGKIEDARQAFLVADATGRLAARAGDAATAFEDAAKRTADAGKKAAEATAEAAKKAAEGTAEAAKKAAEAAHANVKATFAVLAKSGTAMLGAVGDLINSIAEGAKGGVWGAVLAAFMEIAKRTKSAMAFLDTALQFVEKLSTMVEPLVAPIFEALQGVLEIIADVVAPVFKALEPLFATIFDSIKNLEPVMWAIGDLIEALSPILEVIGKVSKAFGELAKPVLQFIGYVIRAIAAVITAVLIVVNDIAAALGDKGAAAEAKRLRETTYKDKATSNFDPREKAIATSGDVTATGRVTSTGVVELKSFDLSKYGLGSKPTEVIDIGGWGYAAGSMHGAEAAREFVEASALINGATAEAAAAAGEGAYNDFLGLGTAASSAAKAIEKFTSSLTNIPTGFKYVQRAFESMVGEGGVGSAGVGGQTTIIIQGNIISEDDLARVLEIHGDRQRFRSTGVSWTANHR